MNPGGQDHMGVARSYGHLGLSWLEATFVHFFWFFKIGRLPRSMVQWRIERRVEVVRPAEEGGKGTKMEEGWGRRWGGVEGSAL